MDGQILEVRYRILQVLCMEEAVQKYLVEDTALADQQFIVKRLHPETQNIQHLKQLRKSFFKEYKLLKQLGQEHDRIQNIYDSFEESNEFYLVQELIVGHQLTEEVLSGVPINEEQVIDLLLELLEILLYIHSRDVIHQNIQPLSIIRRYSDNKLVLVDFGSVQELVTTTVGNLEYIPIEQLQGQPQYNSDIYALGIVAIAAIMGLTTEEVSILQSQKHLFTGELIWYDGITRVSQNLIQIIDKMVRFDYRQRYQSVAAVLHDLQQLKYAHYEPPKRQARKLGLMLIGVASLMIVMITGWFLQGLKLGSNEQFSYQEGISQYEKGNYQEAVSNFTQTIEINPQNSLAYNHRGDAFYRLGDYEKAQADSSRAIALNPQDANAYYDRGFARFGLGKYQQAITDYTQAIKINSQNSYAYYGRGLARVKIKDYQAAIGDFSQAITINSTYGLAYYRRGLLYAQLSNKKVAIADLKKAAKLFQEQGDNDTYRDILQEIKILQK
ncbi:tetratricopeptide repeat protein [Nostoc sp. FACHB-152]|uniref:tetratricopeptide repeat protein n=1 Tax=unclassified Nostoc TaxID=2593658 RepID=UPI00168212AA|nr:MULTISPECIES: tetratricopeptide repeat protein [unclassified Nostoc]MBD2450773.1 tetratricopeptide repeat protein [Nostoc sp. FACHB-152]MBD2470212.1 tetratricopeptide repeat protein [Nostoc sp. FACHB-145]